MQSRQALTILQSLSQAKESLVTISEQPALEAEILLSQVLNKPRSYLHAFAETRLTESEAEQFASAIARRAAGEPIAYITGIKEFWSLELLVNRDTLIPRPETELLVESVLALMGEKGEAVKVADLGTGSGAIAIALAHERPGWQIYASDISEKALQTASKNAQRLASGHISFCHGSWCTALPCTDFDVIVSNPPYIAETEWATYADGLAFEPRMALVSGVDGLEAIRKISLSAKSCLKPGGYLLLEHGFQQAQAVREWLICSGFGQICSFCDLSGHERVTGGRSL